MSSTTPDDPPSPSREHDDRITEMLSILALPQAEREGVAARFCAEHPEHAEGLRCMLSEARAAGQDPAVSPARPSTPATAERLQRLAARAQPAEERYRLDGEVGRGGMGAVLRAWDHDLGRPLAMKVILGKGVEPSGATPSVDADVLQRFLDEAQITGQLDHPGVVPVHELGVDSNRRVYFTMRLVQGQTAEEVFKLAHEGRDGWSTTRALEVILKVCDTLAYAHGKGVIHRDLKPSNVMVGRFGEVYVMDWGLAKVLGQADGRDLRIRPEDTTSRSRVRTDRSQEAESDPDSPLLTMDGAVVGTPCYMSPEQARGDIEQLGERSDVYAVGAMLYTLLTGRQPYLEPGQKASPYAILRWVLDGPPAALRRLTRKMPAELIAICERAMAREPDQRYASAADLGEDLRAFAGGEVVRAYQSSLLRRVRSYWKRQAAPTRSGLVIGYLIMPAVVALILILLSHDAASNALRFVFVLVLFVLVLLSAGLLFAGLFNPRKPRLLGGIAIVPVLLLVLLQLGPMSLGAGTGAPPEWRQAALAAEKAGRHDEAVAKLRLVPMSERAATDQVVLARCLRHLGRLDEALAEVEAASSFREQGFTNIQAVKALLLLELNRLDEAHYALRLHLEDSGTLNSKAWAIVRETTVSPDEARRALAMAYLAVEIDASCYHVNTLGIAQYRCHEYTEARTTLLRARKLRAADGRADDPTGLAFLAMAEQQLGNHDEARKLLARLDEVMPQHADDQEAQSFLAEARTLIGAK